MFVAREREAVDKRLHRRLAVAPAAVMRALDVVALNERIQIGLERLE